MRRQWKRRDRQWGIRRRGYILINAAAFGALFAYVLGTLVVSTLVATSYGSSLEKFDPFFATGQRVFMATCWLPTLDRQAIDVFIRAMATAASPGCAIITHAFRGAASRVPVAATAFGLRRDHVLVEILASFTDRSEPRDEHWNRRWTQATLRAFDGIALPVDIRICSPKTR